MLLVLDFHKIWSPYFKHLWTVFVLKWHLGKDGNVSIFEFHVTETKHTVEILGHGDIKMNAHPLS